MWTWTLSLCCVVLLAAAASHAAVDVRVLGPVGQVGTNTQFAVNIVADISDPVLGWGLDLDFDPALLRLVDPPMVGPDWTPFGGGDGDGLAGVFLPAAGGQGLSGNDVFLAGLFFESLVPGMVTLALGITPGDLNEGFALDPSGFDANVTFQDLRFTVVPEPSSGALVALGLLALVRRRGTLTR